MSILFSAESDQLPVLIKVLLSYQGIVYLLVPIQLSGFIVDLNDYYLSNLLLYFKEKTTDKINSIVALVAVFALNTAFNMSKPKTIRLIIRIHGMSKCKYKIF